MPLEAFIIVITLPLLLIYNITLTGADAQLAMQGALAALFNVTAADVVLTPPNSR
jgi:hypothetical protein